MFGSLHGSAARTWNCVAHFANLFWHKLYHTRYPLIMPRSRRRHHSRSKSRSRPHSHDRDRDAKRRKIDNYDSPHNRRSVSCEDIVSVIKEEEEERATPPCIDLTDDKIETKETTEKLEMTPKSTTSENNSTKKYEVTPKTTLSPRVLQKKAESEKKRLEKQKEREERERKRLEEKNRIREEKEKQKREKELQKMKDKQEKLEQKQKEIEQKQREKELKEEQKRKEREEKEQKRREKEEKEEQKRKEKEQERLKRQQEIDEKNREKQKLEEQKQKAAAAFANFFVPKKTDANEGKASTLSSSVFMPFEVKTDMRLAPLHRYTLSDHEKEVLIKYLNCQGNVSYLDELKRGKITRKSSKTWPFDDANDDVIIVENNLGETIDEQKPKLEKVRVKFLKFHDNRRPPYYGTWRKKSKYVKARNPLAIDKILLDYEVDSDDDWEEDEQGESLNGSDDEDKENDSENEYEEDNVFFVPHGHLSEDEVDDEETAKLNPECHKAKLKLLKNEFEEEMKSKMRKIQPRSIGCVWYNKEMNNVEDAIHTYLKPLAVITNGPIFIKRRSEINFNQSAISSSQKKEKGLQKEHIPIFLQVIHGNVNNQKNVIEEFIQHMSKSGIGSPLSKRALAKQMKQLAQWSKCPDGNKFCWNVDENLRKQYNLQKN